MKRITEQEAELYIPLVNGGDDTCKRAVAYTLTPVEGEPGWEEVSYYGDPSGVYDVNPLEIMLKEWKQQDNANK